MDNGRFDDWARSLVGVSSRRSILRSLAGGLAGGLLTAAGLPGEAAAGKCRSDRDCGGCGRCDRQRGRCEPDHRKCRGCKKCDPRRLRCVAGCPNGGTCCDGRCWSGEETACGPCKDCENGQCVAQPYLEGRECGDCKRCRNGECTDQDPNLLCNGICCQSTGKICVGRILKECCAVKNACDNDCCKDGQPCTEEDGCCPADRAACGVPNYPRYAKRECCDPGQECAANTCCGSDQACGTVCCKDHELCRDKRTGQCCPKCVEGRDGRLACCPPGHACTDDGLGGGDKFCCDVRDGRNKACGESPDGTYRRCCSGANEQCVNGECKPKDECRNGQLTAAGVCCPNAVCDGVCCGPDEICGVDGVCENPYVCPRVYCSNRGLRCCPPNSHTDSAYCCPMEWVCADTVFGCADPNA